MNNYPISSTVPLPTQGRRGSRAKYPFASMKVGDSFFVAEADQTTKNINSAAYCHARYNFNDGKRMKFLTRTETNPPGTRCWRIQ